MLFGQSAHVRSACTHPQNGVWCLSEPASNVVRVTNRPGAALLKVGRLGGALALGALMTLALAQAAQAQLPPPTAADTASHPAYDPPSPEWTTGDNGGFGMGPWTLNPASNTSQNGFFVGSSIGNNGMSGDTNGDGDINTIPGPRAWGLYCLLYTSPSPRDS